MTTSVPQTGRLVSVNIAHQPAQGRASGPAERTGIDKRPADGRVGVRGGEDPGVDGDLVADRKNHGGVDQAVYAYAREDAEWWAAELGRAVPPGAFGENFTTEGLDVTGAVIGELWAVGDALFEVSAPRIPCATFQRFWDVPHLQRRFTEHGASGAYLRVARPGSVGAGDAIEVLSRPDHGLTIGEAFRALSGDRSLAPKLLSAPQLPAEARERARIWLGEPA